MCAAAGMVPLVRQVPGDERSEGVKGYLRGDDIADAVVDPDPLAGLDVPLVCVEEDEL